MTLPAPMECACQAMRKDCHVGEARAKSVQTIMAILRFAERDNSERQHRFPGAQR